MRICIIGIGQMGSQIAKALSEQQVEILSLYNRTERKAGELSRELGCAYVSRIRELPKNADAYLLSVRDDAVEEVAEQMSEQISPDLPVAHTSGVLPMELLSSYFNKYGSWYPLNSFAGDRPIEWKETPIFVSANEVAFETQLKRLGGKLSTVVLPMKDEQRLPLHISAVFVNNFTNYLLGVAEQIVEGHELSFDYLLPLLRTTIERTLSDHPKEIQTGPARRGDSKTIRKHIRFLQEEHPEYADLYEVISKGITRLYGKEE